MSHKYILADQNSPLVVSDGVDIKARGTRDGVQFVASWAQALLLEGRVFSAPFTEMGATDIVNSTGAKTLIQPDFCISVPTGTSLIPLRIVVSAQYDGDLDTDDAFIIVMGDTDAAAAFTVSDVTPITPLNHITTGGVTSVATVFEDASGNITTPTTTKIMLDVTQEQKEAEGASEVRLDYEPELPFIMAGPCAIYGYIGTGADGTGIVWSGMATWAEVPSARYAVSA